MGRTFRCWCTAEGAPAGGASERPRPSDRRPGPAGAAWGGVRTTRRPDPELPRRGAEPRPRDGERSSTVREEPYGGLRADNTVARGVAMDPRSALTRCTGFPIKAPKSARRSGLGRAPWSGPSRNHCTPAVAGKPLALRLPNGRPSASGTPDRAAGGRRSPATRIAALRAGTVIDTTG